MWTCPKCGREFRNTNQDHYCGKVDSIDAYIADQPPEVRPILQQIREIIKKAAPEATEKISWQMPTFWQGENLIHFAAFKKHVGIYPGNLTLSPFLERLAEYHTTKGAIQIPFDKIADGLRVTDIELITDIVRWRVNQTAAQ